MIHGVDIANLIPPAMIHRGINMLAGKLRWALVSSAMGFLRNGYGQRGIWPDHHVGIIESYKMTRTGLIAATCSFTSNLDKEKNDLTAMWLESCSLEKNMPITLNPWCYPLVSTVCWTPLPLMISLLGDAPQSPSHRRAMDSISMRIPWYSHHIMSSYCCSYISIIFLGWYSLMIPRKIWIYHIFYLNHGYILEFPIFYKWWFSIVMWLFTRGYLIYPSYISILYIHHIYPFIDGLPGFTY